MAYDGIRQEIARREGSTRLGTLALRERDRSNVSDLEHGTPSVIWPGARGSDYALGASENDRVVSDIENDVP